MLHTGIQTLNPSPTLLINEVSKQLIEQGKDVIRLGFGQSPFPIPSSVVEALKNNAHQKDYLPGKGLYTLRAAVASFNHRTLGIKSDAENIVIGPGSKELIFDLQLVFDGDLILPSPSWVSYEPQARILNKKVWWIDTKEKNNWLLTPDALETVCNKISNPRKLLILNYPNNPTGVSYSEIQIKALVPILRKHNILLIADEIYGELSFIGKHHSFANHYSEGTIISGGLSKWCGAGGWRLGTFTIPEQYKFLNDSMATLASETFSAVSAPIQFAAVTAFNGNKEIDNYLEKSRLILFTLADYIYTKLLRLGITMPRPDGGFYLFINFKNHKKLLRKKGIETGSDLCELLLKETGIALLPGAAFGRPEEELTARLSYVDFDGSALLQKINPDNPVINKDFFNSNFPKLAIAIERLQNWLTE